jgi:hypothetical protein
MRTNKKSIYTAITLTICVVLSQMFCTTNYAGGSEIGNPNVVTGMVTDSSGNGISNVKVYLVDPMERSPEKLLPDSCHKGYSDENGSYCIAGVTNGVYNLLGINSNGAEMFLRRIEITEPQNKDIDNDTVISGKDTLQTAANVVVDFSGCKSGDSAILFVPGTVINVNVYTCGEYLIRCPSSIIDIVLYNHDSLTVLADDISVLAGQWVDLTKKSYNVPAPQFVSGLISGFIDQVYSFSAGGISLGPIHPVQYRFDWGNAVSPWSFSSQGTHSWSEPGNYQVHIQARSFRDTLSVSEWSYAVDVTIQ